MSCIYALVDPRNGWIRYVGKTRNSARRRMTEHIYSRKREDTPVYRWIRKLFVENLRPSIIILQNVEESALNDAEVFWISAVKDLFPDILNVGDGGEGPIYGESHWKASLSEQDVISIRERYRECNITVEQLSIEYGINSNSMYKVIVGQTWGCVSGALSKSEAKEISKKLKVIAKGCMPISDKQLNRMVILRKQKLSYRKISEIMNISRYRTREALKGLVI